MAGYNAADFAYLAAAGLEELRVDYPVLNLEDAAVTELAKGGTLKELELLGHDITSASLGQLTSLEELCLIICDLDGDKLPPLPHLQRLEIGRVDHDGVGDAELQALAPTLTKLVINRDAVVTLDGLAHLTNLQRLQISCPPSSNEIRIDFRRLPAEIGQRLPRLRELQLQLRAPDGVEPEEAMGSLQLTGARGLLSGLRARGFTLRWSHSRAGTAAGCCASGFVE